MTTEKNPAVEAAKSLNGGDDREIVVLTTGVRARLSAVGANLIEQVQGRVKDPEVPTFFNEDKGREEENPVDPAYLADLAQAQRDRASAAMDAMIVFGVELVDGVPEDDSWLRKLKWLEKRGQLDLSSFDAEDELDREFLFKKYVAIGLLDLQRIGSLAGFKRADVEAAARSFPDRAARDTDQ